MSLGLSLLAPHSYWRDAIAVLSVTMCVMGLVVAWRKSKKDSATIDQFLENIREYETEVIALKKRSVIHYALGTV